jgi:phosphate starvation-inducible PhoH-like protein
VTAKPKPLTLTLAPLDNARLQNLCGALDENLRQIEAAFDVTISRRGQNCRITGDLSQARLAATALQHFYEQATQPLSIDELQLGLIEISRNRNAHPVRAPAVPSAGLMTRKTDLHGRTAAPGASTCTRYRNTTSPSASALPVPARHILRWPAAVDAFERDQVEPHRPHTPGCRGRRAARLPARRSGAESRSLFAARSTTRSMT